MKNVKGIELMSLCKAVYSLKYCTLFSLLFWILLYDSLHLKHLNETSDLKNVER